MRVSAQACVRRGVAGAVFAAVLAGGGTVGCGKSAGSDSAKAGTAKVTPAAAVARAAKDSAQITSLRYRITGTVPEKGRLRAEASMRTKPSAMSMRLTEPDQRMAGPEDIRFVGGVMYVGGAAVSGNRSGKSWLRAEPAVWGRGVADNNSYGVLPHQIQGSPALQSTILTGSKDVRKTGTETVDGTRTTHYRGTVTGRGMRVASMAASDKATRERQIDSYDQFMALGVDGALTMELWIDGDGRARQFRLRGESKDLRGRTYDDPLDLTVTFLEVDKPVTVEAPPAKDTADIAALADEAQKG